MLTLLVGEPFTRTLPSWQFEVVLGGLQCLLDARSSSCSRMSVDASITARPLLKVVWLPEAPPSHWPASVSW